MGPTHVLTESSSGGVSELSTAKKVYESDEQGVVHVAVPVSRPGQRVKVLVVWHDVGVSSEGSAQPVLAASELDRSARQSRLERYTTWTDDELRDFEATLAPQRRVDAKLWA